MLQPHPIPSSFHFFYFILHTHSAIPTKSNQGISYRTNSGFENQNSPILVIHRVSAKGDRGGPWTPPIFFPEKSGFLQGFGGAHGPPQEKWGFGGCR